MSIDVGPVSVYFPSVLDTYSWPDSHSTVCLSSSAISDSLVWGSPSEPRVEMKPNRPEEHPESQEEFQTQLDLFRKLGFSEAQVRAVLLKLGLNTDTNRVLGELIQAGVEGMEERVDSGIAPGLASRVDHTGKGHGVSSLPAETEEEVEDEDAIRPIVIDGSNVAMSHGNKEVFSCLGIQLAVKYFLDRGHTDITVFVPSWRREQPRPDVPITDQHILRELEKKKILVFTPSRRVAGKRVVCYDDRFIVKLAYESDGIIVSNDTYRDLQGERPEWKRFIEERLLMYSFVNDKFMLPDDPLGRHGPTLENFLRKTPRAPKKLPCPYGKKCTYGIKCKFSHPGRAKQSHRSLADELREKAKMPSLSHGPSSTSSGPTHGASLEEVLEQKLSLDHIGPLNKSHTSENVPLIKNIPHSASPKSPSKRDRPGQYFQTGQDSIPSSSHEYLDSGLGSYESHCEHKCRGKPRKPKHHSDGWYRYPPSCSCCSVQSMSSNPGYHHHNVAMASSQTPNVMLHSHPHYHSYGGYPAVNFGQFSVPCNYHHTSVPPPHSGYWSEPYQAYPHPPPGPVQGDTNPWNPPMRPEREQVRKKLRAVFNSCLVDRVMDMFPNLMDAQKLAAEILNLQSYEVAL
ncbi:ribonuclease ZC3H12A [Trichomycterus rosablanca]|uniref:ribonuclease ZC3H12A n=1 Tax=Trichomycterus rosablanca TaxID=2290929 RepID=UPI002F350FB4